MAVQAEFGESASEAGIRQVEVEPTAPISDVSISAGVSLTFLREPGQLVFTGCQDYEN